MRDNVLLLIVLLGTTAFSIPVDNLKRSHTNNENSGLTGYGLENGERDASIEDNVPCGLLQNSGSREYGYDPHEQQDHGYQRGSTSVKAAAAASASSYS